MRPRHAPVDVGAVPVRFEARGRRDVSVWTVAGASALLALLAIELLIVWHGAVGPSLDEAIYMTAGRRTLEGHGIGDGYLSWFAGSLLWPAIAGAADRVAGLGGARAAAAGFVVLGMTGTWRATVALYGRRAGFFAAATMLTAGPVVALAHLAVIDAPAVAGIGMAFWAVTELARRDDRRWLVLAGVAFAFATLSKYPAVACGAPLVAVIVLLRGRRARTDLPIFALIAGAVVLTYFMSQRDQIGYFFSWRASNDPSFGTTRPMIAVLEAWYLAPVLLLAAGGWLASRRKPLASTLMLASLLFPAYHLATGTSVGAVKHAVFGLIFLFPLVGKLLSQLSRSDLGAVVTVALLAGMGAYSLHQVRWIDGNIIDVRPAAEYVATHARAGDEFLIDNSWPFTWRLYAESRIDTPWRVYDAYRIDRGQHRTPLCRFEWFVAAQGGPAWTDETERAIRRCGTFRRVFMDRAEVTGFRRELGFFSWRARVRVYRNVRATSGRPGGTRLASAPRARGTAPRGRG